MAQSEFAEQAGSARTSAPTRWFRSRADLACLALLAVAASAFYVPRLSLGVDLTDESYYATHLVEWLRNGFAGSQNRSLQQLAALFVYIPTRLYVHWVGGLDGLMLFLRLLYAVMTVLAAGPVYLLLRRFGPAWIAALGAAFTIAFIPFGLPAPSYNTIALCGTNATLCLFGLAMLDAGSAGTKGARIHLPLAGAAVAAAVTALAYPTLALLPPALILFALIIGRERADRLLALAYAGWCVFAALVTFGILTAVFGPTRLWQMAEFTAQSAELGGRAGGKILFSYTQISHEPFAAAAILGVLLAPFVVVSKRCARPFSRLSAVFIVCLVAMLRAGPVSWIKSHDVILLGALLAVHVVFRRPGKDVRLAATVRVLVSTSLLAGLITLATATNGIFNFFVGGTTSAVIGLALLAARAEFADSEPWLASILRLGRSLPLLLTTIVLGWVSQTTIYGEYAARRPIGPQRIATGPFADLWTAPDTRRFVSEVSAALAAQNDPMRTMAVFGPYTGVYLLSPLRPWAYSTYTIPTAMGAGALGMTLDLYSRSPPDVVAITDMSSFYKDDARIARLLSHYGTGRDISIGYLHCALLSLER